MGKNSKEFGLECSYLFRSGTSNDLSIDKDNCIYVSDGKSVYSVIQKKFSSGCIYALVYLS